MSRKLQIVALSGSLRAGSYNSAAIRAAMALAPQDCDIELLDISQLPLYNEELDGEHAPKAVLALAKKIASADALLFATPEYNYSISGVLKNAIDWLSRQKPQPFSDKPAAIISASMGILGGVRAQYQLRQMMVSMDVHFVNKPEVMIAQAHEKFSELGELNDSQTAEFIEKLMLALTDWTRRLQR
ncbi:MAG: NADPH-dependent FMN reductase [Oceanisphaera sp.]|uniref:NADPH-dependent FMN reductase n=1 Tax=Oceanisphaera sp. TaxID=1929979 RepID=UPI003F9B06E3